MDKQGRKFNPSVGLHSLTLQGKLTWIRQWLATIRQAIPSSLQRRQETGGCSRQFWWSCTSPNLGAKCKQWYLHSDIWIFINWFWIATSFEIVKFVGPKVEILSFWHPNLMIKKTVRKRLSLKQKQPTVFFCHNYRRCFMAKIVSYQTTPVWFVKNKYLSIMAKINVLYCLVTIWLGSLRNSLVDRCPRPAKTASVQQNTCLCWSERPAISSVFFFFFQIHIAQILFKTFQSSKQFSDLNSYGSQV